MPTPAEELARLQQQIDRCDPESLLDLLDARRERTVARLRAAVAELRAATDTRAAAHERLAALVTAAARTAT
jgi:uncharacterized protein with PhoU and TrkA domain